MHHKQVQFEEKELDPKKIELKSIFSEQKALHYFATNSGVSRYSIRILSHAEKEKRIKVFYNDQLVGEYAADILVEDKVILELKSVKDLHPAHSAQLINYLKATGIEIGLLINFAESVQIKRKILTP